MAMFQGEDNKRSPAAGSRRLWIRDPLAWGNSCVWKDYRRGPDVSPRGGMPPMAEE
jgi:hypothetical protein